MKLILMNKNFTLKFLVNKIKFNRFLVNNVNKTLRNDY